MEYKMYLWIRTGRDKILATWYSLVAVRNTVDLSEFVA